MPNSPNDWTTWLPSIIPVAIGLFAGVFGYGKLKASVVTKTECEEHRENCSHVIVFGEKLDDLKEVVTKQSEDISEIQKSVSKMEGFLAGYIKKEKGGD